VKNTKPHEKDKEEKQKTKKCLPSSTQRWPTLKERFITLIPYQWVLYKEIQKGYKKLASTSSRRTKPKFYHFPNLFPRPLQQVLQEQNLNSTIFPISSLDQETQWFHSPKVFANVFQPTRASQENPHQRPSTLKLPPLIYQVSLSWNSTQNVKKH